MTYGTLDVGGPPDLPKAQVVYTDSHVLSLPTLNVVAWYRESYPRKDEDCSYE